ncbi:MAG: Flagellin protein FlaA [Hydrogenibacillus schlegelii]|uniref:Flagellin n=1 Tax=Hydrogenibacillus schlegelii TaxID=1484 RepID=A0A2T5G3J0_HYDSH|nr:flagellin [Hydrogenibacillus schlegelii]PTQ50760.1 MAG: Flagellin protein FlaA [Hydrogenibacillus schlegelii]
MRINHNISAMNAYRQLTINNTNVAKSLEKLSSGLRINRAGDDAAGLAISEKMRGQIRGLDMAVKNAQDGISLIQTAEGALNETHAILQRMRELAVQSASDTNTDADRQSIQKEIDQLVSELDRIGNTTEFNTKKLLNGSATISATASDGDSNDAAAVAAIKILGGSGDTQVGATFSFATATVATADTITSGGADLASTSQLGTASTVTINGVTFSFKDTDTVQTVLDAINNAGIGVTATLNGSNNLVLTSNTVGSTSDLTISGQTGVFAANAALDLTGAITQGADASLTGAGAAWSSRGNVITVESGPAKGLQFELGAAITDDTNSTTLTVNSNGGLFFHIGANEDQNMYISISDMRSNALGVYGIRVDSQANANAAITTISNAIETVSAERSKLGAYQNRLEHTINNLGTASENLSAAESRIRDVDMAKEMMEFTKNSILTQAAQAMLAQANQVPQGVLQLLR